MHLEHLPMRMRLRVNVVSALRIGDHASELLLPLVCCENENAEDNNSKRQILDCSLRRIIACI